MKDWRGWDVEAGGAAAGGGASLYPNMMESPQLRWAFIRKVYTIVALQIVITIGVAAAINLIAPVRDFLLDRSTASFAAGVAIMILPFLVMLPMMYFSERHPINFVLLVLFTVCIGFAVGLACTTRGGTAILEAATLTAAVVGGLTLYTFWAAKRGHDFSFLGPFLFAALLALTIFSLIQVRSSAVLHVADLFSFLYVYGLSLPEQVLFPMGTITTRVFGCISAVVFAGFIIYDTDNLIKRHSYDQYVCAAISLYLDIINLFLALLSTMED
ncbi:protein LIFEGUARD 2-like isoform X1 [Musa acuminata AAA Group]|uniref:protein LIFEGUARD 2-like isoform X1 n=1 Tax=Musa acuminata AAA Group TaxID=214697 RepID=UPI0008A0B4A5|nr:PREDICTED: BI1-like protein isoform X1 [Musa acuminata subsp. malaccensis]